MLHIYILTFLLVLVVYYKFFIKKKYNFPPGPWRLPIVGSLFSVGVEPQLTFMRWAKEFGPLIYTKFGYVDVLIIDDVKIIKEAFKDPAFNGRKDNKILSFFSKGKHGITNAEGQEWTEQRRFVLKALRDFGFGKQSMESMTMDEVKDFIKWLKDNEGKPTAVDLRFIMATTNGLWTIMAGERHDPDDPFMQRIIKTTIESFTRVAPANGCEILFPELFDYIPLALFRGWRSAMKTFQEFDQILADTVESHMKDHSIENPPRDLIDVYLTEVKKETDQNSSFYKKHGVWTLKIIIGDLYGAGAGIGTTPSILSWSVLYLIRYPDKQKKFQQELDEVVGKNRLPSLSDRPNLPYTEALMTELYRIASITPLSLIHEAMHDTKINGYDVRKGTMVIPNFYSVHHNEKIWGDPENFRPERFLSSDEKTFIRSENVIAFGTGKRQCAGEALGRDTYFLFLTSVFQRFQITVDPANPKPTLEAELGFFRRIQKFEAIFKDRFH